MPDHRLLAAIDDSNGKAVSGGVSPRSIAAARSVEILSAIFLLFSCWCFYMADESSGLAEGNVEPLKATDGDGPSSGHPIAAVIAQKLRDCGNGWSIPYRPTRPCSAAIAPSLCSRSP